MYTRMHFSLHDAVNCGDTHERISDEPRGDATKRACHEKFENGRSGEWMKQKADSNEHRRMNDVNGISASIKPRPQRRWSVHPGACDEQPCGDESPRYERIPEGVHDRGPCVSAAKVCLAGRKDTHCDSNANGHAGPRYDESDDPGARLSPLKLAKPIIAPCCDANREQEDIRCEIAELQPDDVFACGNELANEKASGADKGRAQKPSSIRGDRTRCAGGLCE